MGRHSASYLAAQQGLGAEASAAAYIGRVGALALALGIGAAVAGGTGIANAEGTADGGTGGGTGQAAANPASTAATNQASHASSDPEPAESTGGASTSTGSTTTLTHATGPTVPTMQLGNGRDTSTSVPKTPGSLPELIASIPQRIATALAPHPIAVSNPSSTVPADESTTPRVRSHTSASATAGAVAGAPDPGPGPTDDPTDDPTQATPFVQRLANAAASAIRGDGPPVALASVASDPPPAPASRIAAKSLAAVQVTPTVATPAPANPIATVVTGVLSALGLAPTASSTGGAPIAPFPIVQAVLQLVRRELELITLNLNLNLSHAIPVTAVVPTNPTPAVSGVPDHYDEVSTVYGNIGKWMLQSNGEIANYGGVPYGGKTLLEPVNVIIVDPHSTSGPEAAAKLNTAMLFSGFPAQPIHSGGFQGRIDDNNYGQEPSIPLLGYSDNFFVFPNNHGRIFGPDPLQTDAGYVWSGAFSTEEFVFYGLQPAHAYVSSDMARNALAMRMIYSGQATYGGVVALNNAYDTETTTTGDHDGYAVVLILN